ncbi:MAG: hypothetical protein Nkreftii_001465 [Candidatus Nitrospira kreftii]|uniref:Uncharacterized protein n=1 Tax=Candidatus Nitrospira kreftii TaxID=2652173 RepID=A0A7S8IYY9_9BACT|nr:MAG: hypothetical protein Nkreftii_001465 [Candidatus Nitrospira kreftii]
MARARAAEQQRSRSKTALIEEITLGITKFQEVVAAISDIGQEGFPYRDAGQSKAELQFRECLRHTFGERSQEYQTYRNFKIRTADKAEITQTLTVIKGLIHTLEDQKLELQGLKPPSKAEPPPEASPSNTARIVLVSSTAPATVTTQATSPMTIAMAMTTNVEPPSAPVTPMSQAQPADSVPSVPTQIVTPTPSAVLIQAPPLTPAPAPTQTSVSQPAEPATPPITGTPPPPLLRPISTPAVQLIPSALEKPVESAQAQLAPMPTPAVPAMPTQPNVNFSAPVATNLSTPSEASDSNAFIRQDSSSVKPSTSPSPTRASETIPDQDPLQLIRKVCLHLHSVARQLRLRRDYRPTLEIDDDYDLQDLLCALLKMEFDEVATEEWTPPYTEGTPRTMLLVNRDQIAIVAKKTRSGLTAKELADQVTADSAYYRAQGRGSTLFCFMYDPEGRIGSPKRLETTLTSVSEHCRVEVLVAPK